MYKIIKLSNGLPVIISPMRGTKTATVLFMAGTGSKYENRKNNGISHFIEHMMFKGTKKRPNALDISSELDGVGGEYNAFTDKEATGYWVKVESGKIELALDVVSDMLLNSKFETKEINREKGVIIEELNMYLDNPMIYVEDLFEELLYGNTPAGWDVIGSKNNINGFCRQDFIKYFKSQYKTSNSVICIAGNVKPDIIKTVKKYFNKFETGKAGDKLDVCEQQDKPRVKAFYKKTDQAHISLGVRSYQYRHKDMIALKLLGVILGGSMSSRLFIQLRERNGLAYYVRTTQQSYTDTGYLTTRAGVPVGKTEKAIKIILSEYKKIAQNPIEQKELTRVKDYLIGRSALQFEISDNITTWYARQSILRLQQQKKEKIVTPENYYKEIKEIKASDINRVARDIFTNQKLNLAIIGPYKNKIDFEKILKVVK